MYRCSSKLYLNHHVFTFHSKLAEMWWCNPQSQISLCLTRVWAVDRQSKHGGWGSGGTHEKGYRSEDKHMTRTLACSARACGGRRREVGGVPARGYRDESWRTVRTTWTGPAVEWVWIFIRLYLVGVVWEKGNIWPSGFASTITADIWICGQADWIRGKHQREG